MERRRLGVAALVACALAVLPALTGCGIRGVQMQESALLRLLERKYGLLAYVGPDGNIYTIDQTGKNRKQVTTDAAPGDSGGMAYDAPTWSFDGKHLAYGRYRDSADGEHLEGALILGDRDGANPRVLAEGSTSIPTYIYFSPDSRNLSVLLQRAEGPLYELGIFPVKQAGAYRVLDSGTMVAWMWRMDGKSLVDFVDGERLSIVEIDPEPTRTDIPVEPGLFQAPDVSPDGKRLLYVSGKPGSLSLVLRTLQGGAESTIVTSTGLLYFGFSPDGKRIAYLESFSESALPAGKLTIVSPGSKDAPVQLKDEPVLGFYWSPDSKKLAYFIPSPPQKAEDLDEAFALDENMAYIAVMIADPRTGRSWLGARFPTTQRFLENLFYFDLLQRSDTMWSPDSRYFVFGAYAADGNAGLFIASADGNLKPRFIDYGENSSWSRR